MALRVGCVPDISLRRVQSFVGLMYEYDPQLAIDLVHLRTVEQLARLVSGRLDIGLIHQVGTPAGIRAAPLFRGEPMVVFLPPGHRLASTPALSTDALEQEILVIFPRTADPPLHDHLAELIRIDGRRFRAVYQTGGADARDLLFAVADARGVAIGPLSMHKAAGELSEIVVARRLHPPLWMPDTLLAWAAQPAPQLQDAVTTAREIARDLYSSTLG